MPPRRSSGLAREKQSPLLCRRHLLSCYRVPLFKSKAAFLVLLWGFSGLYIYNQLVNNTKELHPKHTSFDGKTFFSDPVIINMGVLAYPLLGWFADVCYGRYKVIKCSIWTMWIVSVLACQVSVVTKLFKVYGVASDTNKIEAVTSIVLKVAMALSLGGFQANIVQFGVGQLVDASSGEITSFIRWYGWMYFLSKFMATMAQNCVCHNFDLLLKLVTPALLSAVICLDYFCVDWLVKEQVYKNPLVVIFQVLKYAVKNKYPRLRSAFTYWDDKRYSRIDLAKTKFGGPFTAGQVEDVKMFWRILLLLGNGTFFASMIVHIGFAESKLKYHLKHEVDHGEVCGKDCFWGSFIENSGSLSIVVFVPLLEFLFYPLFKIHLKVSIFKKVTLGMVLIFATVSCYGILVTVGHYQNQSVNYINTTCLLDLTHYHTVSSLSLSYTWIIIPTVTYNLGSYLLVTVLIEFICAQSPYSMKGLLFGAAYGMIGLFIVINLAWLVPLQYASKKWAQDIQLVGCGTLYFLSILVVILINIIVFGCSSKHYKKRLRDEDHLSEEILYVDNYSQYQ